MHKPTCRFLENSKNVKPHIIQHPEPLNGAPQTTKGVASCPARSKSPGQESCSSGDDAFSEASTTRNGPLTIKSRSPSFDGRPRLTSRPTTRARTTSQMAICQCTLSSRALQRLVLLRRALQVPLIESQSAISCASALFERAESRASQASRAAW